MPAGTHVTHLIRQMRSTGPHARSAKPRRPGLREQTHTASRSSHRPGGGEDCSGIDHEAGGTFAGHHPSLPPPDGSVAGQSNIPAARLVTRGMTSRQLAAELSINANTTGVRVSRNLTELGAATRTEAPAFSLEHNLLADR